MVLENTAYTHKPLSLLKVTCETNKVLILFDLGELCRQGIDRARKRIMEAKYAGVSVCSGYALLYIILVIELITIIIYNIIIISAGAIQTNQNS